MIASILINSNNKSNLERVFNSYEKNALNFDSFEFIINIDDGDNETKLYLEEQIENREFTIKYIEAYEGDYFSGHINNNKMLDYIDERSYFISCTGDRVLNETKNWDEKLKRYKNFYVDDIFRIRCSSYKDRNYFDFWECCFAPSNITFTTVKLIKIIGDLSPCFSHDAFQQCVFFYLESHDNFKANQINRDVTVYDIEFSGDKPSEKSVDQNYERIHGQLKAWNILTSWKIQKEAFRRAMLIKANILANHNPENFQIYDDQNHICIVDKSSGVVKKYNYNISRVMIFLKNLFRKFSYLNYCGGGIKEPPNKVIFSIIWYLDFRYKILRGLKDFYNRFVK
tara:strand:- start:703 stop:1722 length:1020 start_codon:yes stop_codon:yes gene_type:complete